MRTKSFEVQKAIYSKLKSDEQLATACPNIYDCLPETKTYPYIVFSKTSSERVNTKTTYGELITIEMDYYAMCKGKQLPISIYNLVQDIFDFENEELSVEGAYVIENYCDNMQVAEIDNNLYNLTWNVKVLLDLE